MTVQAPRRFLREQAYIAIRDAIADGVLEPGERLREDEIVQWLGGSRASIRDALARLNHQGLVEMVPNRYTRVAPVEPADIVNAVVAQTVFFRIAVTEGVPKLTPAAKRELQSLFDGAIRAIDEDRGPSVYLQQMGDYIRVLARVAGNELLPHYIDECGPLVFRAMSVPGIRRDPDVLKSFYGEIHARVSEGDVDGAVEVLREFATSAVAELGGLEG